MMIMPKGGKEAASLNCYRKQTFAHAVTVFLTSCTFEQIQQTIN